jgi:uncharacterized LabA/DUF88 family protein
MPKPLGVIEEHSQMPELIHYFGIDNIRAMIFVDGENLAIRFGAFLKSTGLVRNPETVYRPDVYLWWRPLSEEGTVSCGGIIRTHYYTAVQGDHPTVDEVANDLKQAGVEAPRVFKKAKGVRSKRVDITLATEMLLHGTRRNYDIAILVAGDEDYVPLIEAVQLEGRGVHVWYIPEGLSPRLVQAADQYTDLSPHLTKVAP